MGRESPVGNIRVFLSNLFKWENIHSSGFPTVFIECKSFEISDVDLFTATEDKSWSWPELIVYQPEKVLLDISLILAKVLWSTSCWGFCWIMYIRWLNIHSVLILSRIYPPTAILLSLKYQEMVKYSLAWIDIVWWFHSEIGNFSASLFMQPSQS